MSQAYTIVGSPAARKARTCVWVVPCAVQLDIGQARRRGLCSPLPPEGRPTAMHAFWVASGSGDFLRARMVPSLIVCPSLAGTCALAGASANAAASHATTLVDPEHEVKCGRHMRAGGRISQRGGQLRRLRGRRRRGGEQRRGAGRRARSVHLHQRHVQLPQCAPANAGLLKVGRNCRSSCAIFCPKHPKRCMAHCVPALRLW